MIDFVKSLWQVNGTQIGSITSTYNAINFAALPKTTGISAVSQGILLFYYYFSAYIKKKKTRARSCNVT